MLQANVERYLHNVLDRDQYAYVEKMGKNQQLLITNQLVRKINMLDFSMVVK